MRAPHSHLRRSVTIVAGCLLVGAVMLAQGPAAQPAAP